MVRAAAVLLALTGCAAESTQAPPRAPRESRVAWVRDFEAARASGRPVLVCFLAAGCHDCEAAEDLFEDEEVRGLLSGFSCVRYDVSRGGVKLYRDLGLTNHPAIAFYSAKGEELESLDYAPPKRDLLRLLRAAR